MVSVGTKRALLPASVLNILVPFVAEMKNRRGALGLNQEQLGQILSHRGWSPSIVSRFESINGPATRLIRLHAFFTDVLLEVEQISAKYSNATGEELIHLVNLHGSLSMTAPLRMNNRISTPNQEIQLELRYNSQKHLSSKDIYLLSEGLCMSYQSVSLWLRNRRARDVKNNTVQGEQSLEGEDSIELSVSTNGSSAPCTSSTCDDLSSADSSVLFDLSRLPKEEIVINVGHVLPID